MSARLRGADDAAAAAGWIYSSFAAGIGGGNPAGVVLSSAPLTSDVCQAIASILSVPTTGFVLAPPAAPASPLDVRFFTPDTEIDAAAT
jgi:predicted PhzF superfamily epimerase YddE/YHI9